MDIIIIYLPDACAIQVERTTNRHNSGHCMVMVGQRDALSAIAIAYTFDSSSTGILRSYSAVDSDPAVELRNKRDSQKTKTYEPACHICDEAIWTFILMYCTSYPLLINLPPSHLTWITTGNYLFTTHYGWSLLGRYCSSLAQLAVLQAFVHASAMRQQVTKADGPLGST